MANRIKEEMEKKKWTGKKCGRIAENCRTHNYSVWVIATIATEDVVMELNQVGYDTDIDLAKLSRLL